MDRSVQVRAFVAMAGRKGKPWLQQLNDEALAAVMVGDEEVTTSSYEGGSASGARKFNAQDLLEVTQLALEQIAGTAEPKTTFQDLSRRYVSA